MKANDFVKGLKKALNSKTIYAKGFIGSPITKANIEAKRKQYPSWYTKERMQMFEKLYGKGYFGFDCICLGKAVCWGWNGDATKARGGAVYLSNGCPDFPTDKFDVIMDSVSTDFSQIPVGAWLYIEGHVGYYIGNGEVIECTPRWENKVLLTRLYNTMKKPTGNGRIWLKWGLPPFIDYGRKSNEQLADEVIAGKWGNYPERKKLLEGAGYSYRTIQDIVNAKLKGGKK